LGSNELLAGDLQLLEAELEKDGRVKIVTAARMSLEKSAHQGR